LGESGFVTFLRVTLPLAMPGVISAVMIVFIPVIGDYVTPHLVGGPEGKMVANLVYLQYVKLDNYPVGSAVAISSMLLVGLVLIMAAVQMAVFGRVFKRLSGRVPMYMVILVGLAAAQGLLLLVVLSWLITGNTVVTAVFAGVLHLGILYAMRRAG
jgi:ABC-type Fe3+ transport system permease subunit